MKVAIDAHALGKGQAGYESYLRHLTEALPLVAPGVEFLLYRDLPAGRIRRLLWDLPSRLLRDLPDVLHVQYAAPIPCPVPLVATIHDVSFVDTPEFFPAIERMLLQVAVKRTVRIARRIITVSEFSKRRLMAAYGISERRVIVAPNAAGSQFEAGPRTRSETPYIVMTGDLSPRKNHLGAIRAFAGLAARQPHRLKIAGRDTTFSSQLRREAAHCGAGDRIDFLGYVPDIELPALYRNADCCLYPSFYEGFGLPVLEAMACGTPVVTSRGTAMEEVAGGAALLADPANPAEIANAIEAAIRRRSELSEAGIRRARQFSWRDAAAKSMRAFQEACKPVVTPIRQPREVRRAS